MALFEANLQTWRHGTLIVEAEDEAEAEAKALEKEAEAIWTGEDTAVFTVREFRPLGYQTITSV